MILALIFQSRAAKNALSDGLLSNFLTTSSSKKLEWCLYDTVSTQYKSLTDRETDRPTKSSQYRK